MMPNTMQCSGCQFYRQVMELKTTKFGGPNLITPIEREHVPTGTGECMLLPPSVSYQQAAVDHNKTWAGPVTSVIEPGFKQQRPIVKDEDFCSQWKGQAE